MRDRAVIDASVVIASLLPDEPYRAAALRVLSRFLTDTLELVTTSLLRYELANALLKAIRSGRIEPEAAFQAIKEFEVFSIPEREVSSIETLRLANAYERSAYDAAYLALAQAEDAPFITADRKLYNALKGRFNIVWVEDFS